MAPRAAAHYDAAVIGSQPCVALVEDDAAVGRALERLLTAVGFEVRWFGTAGAFLAALPVLQPSCVVLDAHLPDADGLDLYGRLQRTGATAGVVFITADHELASSEGMRRTGVACLRKPLDETTLVEAIGRAIAARRA
ncbi:MAG TPA: response regulator [Vicinamibacterales bacterium]|nr:response regulator [Vicinamibacterales bacterium]